MTAGSKSSGKPNYPDSKLLSRERKVNKRGEKERLRGGTKHLKEINTNTQGDISGFLNSILCGDSEIVLKDFPENSIDIIVTSPPYNFGLDYKDDKNNDAIVWNDYFAKLMKIWIECKRVLKQGGRLCVNIQPLFSDYMPTHHII